MIVLNVTYHCKPGLRDAFIDRIAAEGIGAAVRAEDGNFKYDYYLPAAGGDDLLLLEKWRDAEALAAHAAQPHMARLRGFKDEYVADTVIERFEARE